MYSRALSASEDADGVAAKARAFDILTNHLCINTSTLTRWRMQYDELPTAGLKVEDLLQAASRMPSLDFARASLKVCMQ